MWFSSYILVIIILKKCVFPIGYNAKHRCVYIASLPVKHMFSHHRCEHWWYSYYKKYMKSRQLVAEGSSTLTTCGTKHLKEGQLRSECHLVGFENSEMPSTSSVWPCHHREDYIGFVLGPFTALYISFLKRCTLTNKAVETIWRALSKPSQRRQGPYPRPLY